MDELEELKRQQEEADTKRAFMGVAGNVLQGLTDAPSAYELYTGKKSGRADVKGMMGAAAGAIKDPMSEKQKAYAFLESKRKNAQAVSADDPNSADSVAYRTQIANLFPGMAKSVEGMSKAQIEAVSPLLAQKIRGDTERENRVAADKLSLEKFRQEQAMRQADKKEMRDYNDQQKRDKETEERTTPLGVANNADDAKKLKEAYESKSNFDKKIQEMIDLRTKHGGGAMMNREDVGRGKQLSKDLLLEYKNMAKLGVLSSSDEAIINAIIPEDPLAYNSPMAAMQGQDPILHRLKKFKGDSDTDFQTRVKTRVKGAPDIAPANAPPKVPTVGEIRKGHRFLGGDPSDPAAWEKVSTQSARK